MASFTQWAGKKNLKRITWLCGPEQVLQREVVDAYRAVVPAEHTLTLYPGQNETEIWDEVLAEPAGPSRLVIVKNADKLKLTGNFTVLAEADTLDSSFTVFCSDLPDAPREGRELLPHLVAIQKCRDGQIVRCAVPSKEEDLVRLVSSWWPGTGGNLAFELLKRVGGDLGEAREACWKAVMAGLEPSPQTVEIVAETLPSAGYVESLLAGDRSEAADLASKLTRDEVGYSLAVLAGRLESIDLIREARQRGMERSDIAVKMKIDRYTLARLFPVALHYSPERLTALRALLAEAESFYRAGAYEGIAEALVALW
jgi:DNA polymerase III delta subunit